MSFFTGFMQGAATEAVEIQKENKTRRQELVDKAMDRFYEFTLPEQRKYAERQRKLTSTMRALEAAGYSSGEARALISASGEDATAAQILQYAKPPKSRTTATESAPEVDQTTAALGAGTTEPTAAAATETAGMAPEMPTAGAAPEVSAPTDTQTASTTPAGGFDLGRVLFDQNSPERTTGAILAALSAETGLKPEQIDAYLRGEFGSDVMQGEMAPIELEPVSAAERWKNEREIEAADVAFGRQMELAEFNNAHDFALARQNHEYSRVEALAAAELEQAKVSGPKLTDLDRLAKDTTNAVGATRLYGDFTVVDGTVVFSAADENISRQASLHSSIASTEATARRLQGDQSVTAGEVAEYTSDVIVAARNANTFIQEGQRSGQATDPAYYVQAAAAATQQFKSRSATIAAVEALYAAWKQSAPPELQEVIDQSKELAKSMLQG